VERVGDEEGQANVKIELEDEPVSLSERDESDGVCPDHEGFAGEVKGLGVDKNSRDSPVGVGPSAEETQVPGGTPEHSRQAPLFNVGVLATLFVVVVLMNLLKGGGAYRSPIGVECGSPAFWMLNLLILLWIAAVVAFVRRHLMRQHEAKVKSGHTFVDGDVVWDSRTTIAYPLLCSTAGFVSGLFGIGGGIGMLASGWPRVA
jgi:hypothetical protein